MERAFVRWLRVYGCQLPFGPRLGQALVLVTEGFVKLYTKGTRPFLSSTNFSVVLAASGPPTVKFY